jgi:hypothetical protein
MKEQESAVQGASELAAPFYSRGAADSRDGDTARSEKRLLPPKGRISLYPRHWQIPGTFAGFLNSLATRTARRLCLRHWETALHVELARFRLLPSCLLGNRETAVIFLLLPLTKDLQRTRG